MTSPANIEITSPSADEESTTLPTDLRLHMSIEATRRHTIAQVQQVSASADLQDQLLFYSHTIQDPENRAWYDRAPHIEGTLGTPHSSSTAIAREVTASQRTDFNDDESDDDDSDDDDDDD